MINVRTTQQSQTQESIGEHTLSVSTQSAQPCMTEYDINATVSQRRGHLKGVGRQLTRMASLAGASSTVAGSSTSIPGSTLVE